MGTRREQLDEILKYAAERGIPVPADVLLEIGKQDAKEMLDGERKATQELLTTLRKEIAARMGAFCETVKDGYNGYKCWTHREFVDAARNIDKIKPKDCRKWAMQYTLDAVAPMYKRYFTRILNLVGKGWYA